MADTPAVTDYSAKVPTEVMEAIGTLQVCAVNGILVTDLEAATRTFTNIRVSKSMAKNFDAQADAAVQSITLRAMADMMHGSLGIPNRV